MRRNNYLIIALIRRKLNDKPVRIRQGKIMSGSGRVTGKGA